MCILVLAMITDTLKQYSYFLKKRSKEIHPLALLLLSILHHQAYDHNLINNKDENVHRSTVRGEKREKERDRETDRERKYCGNYGILLGIQIIAFS